MQEEVENKSISLAITTTKLTWRSVAGAVKAYMRHREKVNKFTNNEFHHGKQSVRELIGQNQGVSTIDIADTNLRGFERVAKKYGVDFAIKKDKAVTPPKYTVFFKARDADALTAAFKEYSAQALNDKRKPSVRKKLAAFVELVASIPKKVHEKKLEKER